MNVDLRKDLAAAALCKAEEVRANYGLVDDEPLCIYDLCKSLKIKVQFVDINTMEGTYLPGRKPRILITAKRPAGRRVFTCAHELGHHVFGHSGTLDKQIDHAQTTMFEPDEYLANCFAGFLLMPKLSIEYAFVKRGWILDSASAEQLYTVACEFGVGFQTLTTHMHCGIRVIDRNRYNDLKKVNLKLIRRNFVGRDLEKERLIVVDKYSEAPVIEAEESDLILFPSGTTVAGDILAKESESSPTSLFRAARRGVISSQSSDGADFKTIRVTPYQWSGLDKHRYEED